MSLESKATQKLSYSKKKFLQKEVPKLTKNEHHEIFNIIKQIVMRNILKTQEEFILI